jgi:hypothetical protein
VQLFRVPARIAESPKLPVAFQESSEAFPGPVRIRLKPLGEDFAFLPGFRILLNLGVQFIQELVGIVGEHRVVSSSAHPRGNRLLSRTFWASPGQKGRAIG